MRYEGREIDAISLWSQYVDFPPNMDENSQYLPLVKCPNPEHHTDKRHFQINQKDGLTHCFAQCGISGTFVNAISMIEGCDARKARKIILGFKTIGTTSRKSKRVQPDAEGKVVIPNFNSYLPNVAANYLSDRDINEASISLWGIGWDAEELRIVIPAKDLNGETRFLIKRAVKDSQHPKYLYEPEGIHKNRLLFGGCFIDPGMIRSQGLILVEGSLDAIKLHQNNFRNCVATLGTGISYSQSRIVARFRPRAILLFFDRDTAGVHGIEIAKRRLARYPLYVCRYPAERSDPAELSGREVDRAIHRAIPYSVFSRRTSNRVISNTRRK